MLQNASNPIHAIRPSPHDFLEVMRTHGYEVFYEKPGKSFNLNIVGYRNKNSRPNHFDDVISVYYQWNGEWVSRSYVATTLPGTPYLLTPMNPKGTAILVPGQYKGAFVLGKHKGLYTALVQRAALPVYRDNDFDEAFDKDEESIERGWFGINIHRASALSKLVGVNSAGCQVIRDRNDYDDFIQLCQRARILWGNSFTYTLVEV